MIKLNGTTNTPKVVLDFEKGILKISGRSFPEYPEHFYTPIVNELKNVETDKIEVIIEFDYLNTSSTKCVLILFKELKNRFKNNVKVTWSFEEDDDDIREVGEDFSDLLGIKFNFVETVEQ
jgi:hypothetical protein